MKNESQFREELTALINRQSMENGSNTPDFLLAEYLTAQLNLWDQFVTRREYWYGRAQPHQSGNIFKGTTRHDHPHP